MQVSSSEKLEELIQSELATGEYANREDLLMAALYALREEREHLQAFREQLARRIAEVDRGEGIEFNDEGEMRAFMDGLDRKFAIKHGLDPDAA
jgi:Arc/MetJ-type ribon-helix-helix transcriptional regulator